MTDYNAKNNKFTFNKAIGSSALHSFDFKQKTYNGADTAKNSDDYAPFRNVKIINTGTTDLKLKKNHGDDYDLIPAGTIYDPEADQSCTYLSIENDSSTTEGEYTLTVDNDLRTFDIMQQILRGMRNG